MGGSTGGSKSDSSSSNNFNFNQRVPRFQRDALTDLYGQLGSLYGSTVGGMNGLIPGAVDYAQNAISGAPDALNSNLQGGVYGGLNIGNQLMDSLNQSLNNPSATQSIYSSIMGGQGNDYADAMRGQLYTDADRAQNLMLGNLDARAAASGMSGGSRHGTATAQGMQDINLNLQKNLTDVGYNTFDKDLMNKLGIAQQADANTFNRQNLMANMLGQQQGAVDTGISQSPGVASLGVSQFAPYMMPWQAASGYAQGVGNPITLSSGSGSGSGSSSGKGMSNTHGVGAGKS